MLVANQKLLNPKDGKPLSLEVLTMWLAEKAKLPYMKIDPMKIDAGAITQVISHAYAQRYRILPVAVSPMQVVIATCRAVGHALARRSGPHPAPRYPARGRQSGRSESFPGRVLRRTAFDPESEGCQARYRRRPRDPQLRAAARARQGRRNRRRRSPRRAHRRLAAAVRIRTARVGHPSRTAPRCEPGAFPHRWR